MTVALAGMILATPLILPTRPVAVAFDRDGMVPFSLAKPLSREVREGVGHAEAGRWRAAYESFDAATRRDPHDLAARAGRARAARRAGTAAGVRNHLKTFLVGPWRTAARTRIPVGVPEAFYEIGVLDEEARDGSGERSAMQALAPVWDMPGAPNPLKGRDGWPVRLLIAELAERDRRSQSGEHRRLWAAVLRDVPASGWVRHNLAGVYGDGALPTVEIHADGTRHPVVMDARQPETAWRVLSPLLASHPNHPRALYLAGYISECRDRNGEAVSYYRRYLAVSDPTDRAAERRADVQKRIARLTKR